MFTSNDFETKINFFEEYYRVSSDGDFNTIKINNQDDMETAIQELLSLDKYRLYKGFLEGFSVFLIVLALELPLELVKPLITLQLLIHTFILFSDFGFLMTQNINF